MLPQLSNEVWTTVLGKLNAVRDFGRLQQVSRPFHAAIADVGWTKVKRFESESAENVVLTVDKQKLMLPMGHRLLLVTELAKKATNITDVSFKFTPGPADEPSMWKSKYLEFLGRALDKLTSAPVKIRSLEIEGDLGVLSPMFPSLARFVHANSQTLEKLSIRDTISHELEERPEPPLPAELLRAFQGCSELQWAHLAFYFEECGYARPLKAMPLLESVLSGKQHLNKLDLFAVEIPVSAVLDSGIRLLEFSTDSQFLSDYSWELLQRQRLAPTDDHPLLSVKKLIIDWLLMFPSFLPNLEHVVTNAEIEGDFALWLSVFLEAFFSQYEDFPGGERRLTCDIMVVSGVGSAEELANKVQERVPCRATIKPMEGAQSEVVFSRWNAMLICRVAQFLPRDVDQ